MKTNFSSLLFWLLLLRTTHADLIPRERLVDWTPGVRTGVIGGIPTNQTHLIDVTRSPYNADNTAATDASSAIQSAINAAGPKAVVYLPAGTYRIDSALALGPSFSGKTLRGAGPDRTKIDQRGGNGLVAGNLSGIGPPQVTPMRVVSGMARGSTSVRVSPNTDNLSVGQLFFFMVQSDLTLPVASVYNFDVFTDQAPTNQQTRIVSKTSNTITFTPPLMNDYGAGSLEVRITRNVFQGVGIGIEDLTVDATNAPKAYSCIQLGSCYSSWLKNCKILHAYSYPVSVTYSLNCEIRHCTIIGIPGQHTNGAGILFGGHSCLVEDNIITDAFPIIEVNGGSAGNVFAYNYGPPDGMWDTNHAPHNQFNLYEGNALGFTMSDGYFGSEAYCTIFRNYFHGSYGVNLKRFNRKSSVVGNMLPNAIVPELCGDPNMGNGYYKDTAQLSAGHPWRDWHMTATVTARKDDDHGEITLHSGRLYATQVIGLIWGANHDRQMGGNVASAAGNVVKVTRANQLVFPPVGTEVSVGPGSFFNVDPSTGAYIGSYQERDLDVGATLIQKGNRLRKERSFQSLGGDALPDSLFRTSKPRWFGNLTWPPYDPITPRKPSIEDIPAGYRYVHGVDPPTPAPRPGETPEPQRTDLPPDPGATETPEPQRTDLPPHDSLSATPKSQRTDLSTHDGPSATPEPQQKVQKKWSKSKTGKNWTGKKNSANEVSETPAPMGKN